MSPSSGLLQDLPRTDDAVAADSLLTGIEAIVQIPVFQHRLDAAAGLRTATVMSGYPGSPLGTLDLALERQRALLEEYDVTHVPGVNEELAASTVWGTQQAPLMGGSPFDGVMGIWYGKSPGVDRCGDVFKHGNSMGAAANGGVLVVAGDDPSAKSSTLPNDSRAALFDAQIPVLAPASVPEILQFGLHGLALSRYSGLWTGMKVVTNLADGFASVALGNLAPSPVLPRLEIDGRPFAHVQRPTVNNTVSVLQEEEILNGRLEAAKAYSLANGLNRISHPARDAWIGIAVQGKTHADVLRALAGLGLGPAELERAGVRVFKIGMIYPLEPVAVREFADGLEEILVVEEKRPLVETLIRDALYDHSHRPRVVGKRDEQGALLVPGDGELTPERLVDVLRSRLERRLTDLPERVVTPELADQAQANLLELPTLSGPPPTRVPAFCSGCPHNKSTAGPADALMGGGVGCHSMVYLEDRHREHRILPLTPMGGEGVLWIGAHQFAEDDHMFQNLGDGTLAHSGSLAIRACVAARVNITFKILFNRAVAMTGGQDVAGSTGVPALTRELEAMGVERIIVVSAEPDSYGREARWAPGVTVWPRERLAEAETELASVPRVTALVYDERCAAEERRMRRRGELPRPTQRVVINEAVCEGCGDCQVKSNCLSVIPVDTRLGRKTQIHQSSCNQDFTCIDGDCPSFVTVDVREAPAARQQAAEPPEQFPEPMRQSDRSAFNSYMVGIGGSGVVTVNRLLGMVALRDGWSVAGLDQTGLSQKGGSVVSHLCATRDSAPVTNTVSSGDSDVYFAFDPLAAAEKRHLERASSSRTTAVVAGEVAPTITVITQPFTDMPAPDFLEARIAQRVERTVSCDADAICEELLGDHLPAHVLMLGVAFQEGLLPFSAGTFEEAIEEMGSGGAKNLAAFRWGRAIVADPAAVDAARAERRPRSSGDRTPSDRARRAADALLEGRDLPAEAEWFAADLVDYQNVAYARRYLDVLGRVVAAEPNPERLDLTKTVALFLYRLMAYKDEYEVARLHRDPAFGEQLRTLFPEGKVAYRLHPPLLRAMGLKRKLALPSWSIDPLFGLLRRLRRVRGTAFDPFGHAKVRRVERRLVADYVETIDGTLPHVSEATYDLAVAIAAAPEVIRGYEEIKLGRVEQYEANTSELVRRLHEHG